jgi:N-acetylglucosaminyl-diphospho-decaprenol L-rhamnosyltransferase
VQNKPDRTAFGASPAGLSVIVVSHDSAQYLFSCLYSVYQEAEGLKVEVIVVEDGPGEGSEEIVRELFPDARFLRNPQPLGLSRASNLAAREARGDLLLFLAADAELTRGALQRMRECMASEKDAGIVGARLLNSDFTVQHRSIQRVPTIWRQAFESETLRRRFPDWRIWGAGPLFADPPVNAKVNVVAGACLLIKRELFERIGGFDETYIAHCHDVDLCYRACRAGCSAYFAGDSWVIHHDSAGRSRRSASYFADVMMREALLTFFRQTRGPAYAATFQVLMAMAAVCRLALLGCLLPPSRLLRGADALQELFAKWVRLLRWSVGLERWAKVAGAGNMSWD